MDPLHGASDSPTGADVLDSSCLPGVAVHAADEAVLLALKIAWELPRDDLIAWEAGVRNLQGDIYRRASLRGVAQVLYFEERMEALGFVPELEQSEHSGSSGFDLIFGDPQGTQAP